MKKFFYLPAMLLIGITSFTSCLDDDGNSAEATVDFGASLDSIIFSDPADTVFFESIDTALQELKIVSRYTSGLPTVLFNEHAKIDVNSIPYAVQTAVEQGKSTYQTKVDAVTSSQVRKQIHVAKTPAPLPSDSLDSFRAYFSLVYAYGSSSLVVAKNYSKWF